MIRLDYKQMNIKKTFINCMNHNFYPNSSLITSIVKLSTNLLFFLFLSLIIITISPPKSAKQQLVAKFLQNQSLLNSYNKL